MSTADLELVLQDAENELVKAIEELSSPAERQDLRLAFQCFQLARRALEIRRTREHSHPCGTPACWPADRVIP